jgi:hypothetical protein
MSKKKGIIQIDLLKNAFDDSESMSSHSSAFPESSAGLTPTIQKKLSDSSSPYLRALK